MEISIFEELLRKKLLNAKVHGRVWSGKKLLMATLTKCSSSLPYTMAALKFFFFFFFQPRLVQYIKKKFFGKYFTYIVLTMRYKLIFYQILSFTTNN